MLSYSYTFVRTHSRESAPTYGIWNSRTAMAPITLTLRGNVSRVWLGVTVVATLLCQMVARRAVVVAMDNGVRCDLPAFLLWCCSVFFRSCMSENVNERQTWTLFLQRAWFEV